MTRTAFNPDSQPQHQKEHPADGDEDGIQLERRKELAGGKEEHRAYQKPGRAQHQAPAQQNFRRGRSQATCGTLVSRALGSAVQAARHFFPNAPRSAASRARSSDSGVTRETPIPLPGSTRRTTHSIRSGGSSASMAENLAPTQSGSAISMRIPSALMSMTLPRITADPHSISKTAPNGYRSEERRVGKER